MDARAMALQYQRSEQQLPLAFQEAQDEDDFQDTEEYIAEDKFADVDGGHNVYGAAVLSLTDDVYDIVSGEDHDGLHTTTNIMRLVFTMIMLFANYALQIYILQSTYKFVALPAVNSVQVLYRDFHRDVYEIDGTFNQTKWEEWSYDNKEQFCGVVFTRREFLAVLLLLWTMTCVKEVRDTQRMLVQFCNVASTRDVTRMMTTNKDGDQRIRYLTCFARSLLILLICLPKCLLSVGLWYVGTLWLGATKAFEDLILNAVALEFIIVIDETIFEALFPASTGDDIDTVKFQIVKQDKQDTDQRNGLFRSFAYTAFTVGIVALFVSGYGQALPFFGVLPGYAGDADAGCAQFWEKKQTPICSPWDALKGKDCFGYGKPEAATTTPLVVPVPTTTANVIQGEATINVITPQG